MVKAANLSNLKKAYRYCRKNGMMPTFYAAMERLRDSSMHYEKRIITEEELGVQRNTVWEAPEYFSILVPAYETKLQHFHDNRLILNGTVQKIPEKLFDVVSHVQMEKAVVLHGL